MASFGRFTPSSGGVVETLSYTSPTLSLTQSAGTSPLTATIAGGGVDGSGTANFVSKWSDSDTLTDSLFFSDDDIAKTIWDTTDKGLYFNFATQNYEIGELSFTSLKIDYNASVIKTFMGEGSRGIYLDDNNGIFALGFCETGDFTTELVYGFGAYSLTGIFTIGDAAGLTFGGNLTLDIISARFNINTDRTRLKNLSSTQMNDLSGNEIGDMIFNTTLDTICIWGQDSPEDFPQWYKLRKDPI